MLRTDLYRLVRLGNQLWLVGKEQESLSDEELDAEFDKLLEEYKYGEAQRRTS